MGHTHTTIVASLVSRLSSLVSRCSLLVARGLLLAVADDGLIECSHFDAGVGVGSVAATQWAA